MTYIVKQLRDWGCDTAGAMERMADDEDFYIECLREVSEDPYFDVLKAAIESGDAAKAFEAAHTLKGVLANVGLTPIYNKIVEIVEPLRAGCTDNMAAGFTQLMELLAHLKSILE